MNTRAILDGSDLTHSEVRLPYTNKQGVSTSGVLLLIAQRTIPMGTAYAVWTGIGAVGAFILGIVVFGEAATLARFFSSD